MATAFSVRMDFGVSRKSQLVLQSESVNGANAISRSGEVSPVTFREAELIGLRLMQEERYEDAISMFNQGIKLPGSKKDVIRKQSISGPSPGMLLAFSIYTSFI